MCLKCAFKIHHVGFKVCLIAAMVFAGAFILFVRRPFIIVPVTIQEVTFARRVHTYEDVFAYINFHFVCLIFLFFDFPHTLCLPSDRIVRPIFPSVFSLPILLTRFQSPNHSAIQ
ncbi:unnamed protein product [Calicophoron daubneyi]|uniref:Uncharacterized protein n=1 Tax=Calicophoron daubneyi TaxID=300641 RepID=A0AAV2TQ13_CALDB